MDFSVRASPWSKITQSAGVSAAMLLHSIKRYSGNINLSLRMLQMRLGLIPSNENHSGGL
jgi:hypothetical protein